MRIINIKVNGNIVSKNTDEAIEWLIIAIKKHFTYEIKWTEIKNERYIKPIKYIKSKKI